MVFHLIFLTSLENDSFLRNEFTQNWNFTLASMCFRFNYLNIYSLNYKKTHVHDFIIIIIIFIILGDISLTGNQTLATTLKNVHDFKKRQVIR